MRTYWFQRNEAALNWLALGMLLAAWNACDNSQGDEPAQSESVERRRPDALTAYSYVSVRAYKGHETVKEL